MHRQVRHRWFHPTISIALSALALLGLLTSIFFGLSSYHTAHAANPTLVLNPTFAHYSPLYSSIFAYGTNYGANETVKLYWNYTGSGTGTLETTTTADRTGAFLAQFVTPLAATGSYTVAAVGQRSHTVVTAPFQLLPHLSLNPYASGPNTPLTLQGDAYGADETVKIYWNATKPGTGTLLATAVSNATGSFTANALVPATVVAGSTTPLLGIGKTSKAAAGGNFICYPPTLALAPLSGSAATTLTVSAYGFQGGETVKLYWKNGTKPLSTVQTDRAGSLRGTISVPADTPAGSSAVRGVGQSSHISATNTFTVVAPASHLSLLSGPVGVRVKLTGQGYAPNEQVTIFWNYAGPGTGSTLATGTAGVAGTLSVGFAIPPSASGSYTVAAVGMTSNRVTTNTYAVTTGLAASPPTRAPGTATTVSGSGFQANEAVTLSWDTASGTTLATTTADAQGNINVGVTFPTTASSGSHTVIAVGQASGRSFSAPVTVDAVWNDFGFDAAHHRENPYENSLNTTTVANLQLTWSATMAQGLRDSPVYANGSVYSATTDGKLDAYNATTGALQWQFTTQTGFRNYSSPLLDPANGLIFFGLVGRDGSGIPTPFYALDAQTGALIWSMILPGNEFAFPTLGAQTLFVGISNEGMTSYIYTFDEISGQILWQHTTNGGAWGAIGLDGSTHALFSIVGNPANTVISLNTLTGALNWQHAFPIFGPDDDPSSGITVANGQVYVNDKNGNMYGLDEKTGNQVWSTQIGSDFLGGDVSTQAVTANGVLYVGSMDTHLYALNATTGALLWKTPTGAGIQSSPAVANGVVYISSQDGKFYAVNAASGAVVWSYNTQRAAVSSPIVVNGWLYCTSTNGKLYAFHL